MSARVHRFEKGAALLTAMIIVTLVATLAAAMIWQQWRAVQVEAAERGRMQSAWLISGALEWSKLILDEELKSSAPTALTEPWAVPLAEARISTFLAADKNNTDDGPEAFLSGSITDMQSRYNLRNVFDAAGNKVDPDQLAALRRLFQAINLDAGLADRIATVFRDALALPGTPGASPAPPLMPENLDQLQWIGIDPDTIRQMTPYVTLLPASPTLVNVNTASKEVIAAALEIGLGDAQRLVQHRQRTPFKTPAELEAQLGRPFNAQMQKLAFVGGKSKYFEVRGRLRLSDRVLEESSLLDRRGRKDIVTVSRKRESSRESSR